MSKRTLILIGAAILLFAAALFSLYHEKEQIIKDLENIIDPEEETGEEGKIEETKPMKQKAKKGAVITSEIETDKTPENEPATEQN
jgi:hypothetical protein